MNNRELAGYIWSITYLLRGEHKQTGYGKDKIEIGNYYEH
jgi:hypothetical protein